jgi:hypothetical protein
MKVNTNIMVTTVVAIMEGANVTIIKEPRNSLHRHLRVTIATTSVPTKVWLAVS